MLNSMVITVSQLNSYIKSMFECDEKIKNIFVTGEISNFTNHYQSGHIYFSLKENNNIIKAVMFSRVASKIKFPLKNGINVIARGTVSTYEVSGQYQLYVEDLLPTGLGSYYMMFEELKSKFMKEGLFDSEKKKALPLYPKKIGVITSITGAVIHDIQSVLKRRYPLVNIEVYPVQVQGEEAPVQIVKALNYVNENSNADVVIIARGGGSIEELWAFNDENVVRAIYNCNIPIISAVGHETDFTLCDFVADMRAPTPSVAAEISVPDVKDIISELDYIEGRLNSAIKTILDSYNYELVSILNRMNNVSPHNRLSVLNQNVDDYINRLRKLIKVCLEEKQKSVEVFEGKLKILNPLSLPKKGYAILSKGKNLIKNLSDVGDGKNINIILGNDEFSCDLVNIRRINK